MNSQHTRRKERTRVGACAAGAPSSGGFTLLETLIAMVVMMVAGLGASALFLYAVNNNAAASSRSQATAIAQQQMEQLRALPFDDPLLSPSATPVPVTTGGNYYDTNANRFTVTKQITAADAVVDQSGNPVLETGGAQRMSTKIITLTVTPVLANGVRWANQPITVVGVRSIPQRGPYAN